MGGATLGNVTGINPGSASGVNPGLFGSAGAGLATAGSLFNIANGLRSGSPTGYAQAALGGAGLANRAGAFGTAGSTVGNSLGAAGGLLGVYNGLKQGGVQGYGSAAVGGLGAASSIAAMEGSKALAGSLATGAGAIAVPLSIYSAVKNYQSGATGQDALGGAAAGASTGAAIGSIVPGVGTLIGGAVGAVVGGVAGAISSAFGSGKVDPENANFNGFTQAYNAAKTPQEKAQVAASTSNPYLPLAGLFDLRSNQIKGNIPIVAQYGRKGEQQFTTDMFSQMNKAVADGTISKTATTPEIMSKVVQPWINSFGKGQMSDSNSDAINAMVSGLVDDYRTGDTSQLKAIGGQQVFSNLPAFGSGIASTTAAPSAAMIGNMQLGNPAMRMM